VLDALLELVDTVDREKRPPPVHRPPRPGPAGLLPPWWTTPPFSP
jgi:hypothetical protein